MMEMMEVHLLILFKILGWLTVQLECFDCSVLDNTQWHTLEV